MGLGGEQRPGFVVQGCDLNMPNPQESKDTLFTEGLMSDYIIPKDFYGPEQPPVDISPGNLAVRAIEFDASSLSALQALHLLESLKYIARANSQNSRANFIGQQIEKGELKIIPVSESKDGKDIDVRVKRLMDKKTALYGSALINFAKAIGRNELVDLGNDPEVVDEQINKLFEGFIGRYDGSENVKSRNNLMARLRRVIEKDPNVTIGPRGLKRQYLEPARKEAVRIDIDKIFDLKQYLNTFRKPLRDEITGAYNLYPNEKGVSAYIRSKLKEFDEDPTNPERQSSHIAEGAERATGMFYAVALFRKLVLEEAIHSLADNNQNPTIPEYLSPYVADAIGDVGYCMRNNTDGIPSRKFLGQERYIEMFGSRAEKQPKTLLSVDGLSLIELTLDEQIRRINYWKPRYTAVIKVAGTQVPKDQFDIEAIESYNLSDLEAMKAA